MRQSGFRFDGDSVGDQVPACGQAVQAGLKQAWLGYTTAKKNHRRPCGVVERIGRVAAHVDAHPEGRGIEPNVAAAPLVALERHRGAARPAPTPLDRDGA